MFGERAWTFDPPTLTVEAIQAVRDRSQKHRSTGGFSRYPFAVWPAFKS